MIRSLRGRERALADEASALFAYHFKDFACALDLILFH
jgi:hypothetical protein